MTEPSWVSAGAPARAGVTGVLLLPRAGGRAEVAAVRSVLTLGRELDCDVVLTGERVSRHHARVWTDGERFGIEDLGSRNGTYVNGRRLTAASELHDGDRLTFADVDVQFRLLADAAVPVLPRQPPADAGGTSRGPTQPLPPPDQDAPPAAGGASDSGVGVKRIVLAVLESLVATAFSQAIGSGKVGAFALAAIAPLLGTIFALRKDGKAHAGAVVLVTAIALGVTVAGVTAADVALGRSVFPWSTSDSTFVPVPDEGTPDAPKVKMPKLTGSDNVSAMQLLMRAGFDPRNVLITPTPAPRAQFGKVVRTDPPAGRMVPNDAIVKVYIGTFSTP
jgi:pSer/pThr/pTyr-binding forkhead associated (FHA) protein